MAEPYTIQVFVPDGDPESVRIVGLLNWTGVGLAFPRSAWPGVRDRAEFTRAGVYVLTGSAEGTDDELPTIYVGQGDEIGTRIENHYANKEFWDWGYAFVTHSDTLNRAHITWLEYALLHRAKIADRCHFDNATQPREPSLSEFERADTSGFLREMLRILPLLGMRVFEKPSPVATTIATIAAAPLVAAPVDTRDTIVVPAQEDGFRKVFLGENCWYAIRIGGGMIPRIKYIAAYQTAPVSAITHYARVQQIVPYGEDGKFRLVFAEPATPLPTPIPLADAPQGSMQGPRYTSFTKLMSAKRLVDLVS